MRNLTPVQTRVLCQIYELFVDLAETNESEPATTNNPPASDAPGGAGEPSTQKSEQGESDDEE